VTETELELLRLRMSVVILERLVTKTHLLANMASGLTFDEAVQATLQAFALNDDIIRDVFSRSGLDAAQIGLREAELREICERMKTYVSQIKKELGK